jgi:rhodanese-related sulfurtransferase
MGLLLDWIYSRVLKPLFVLVLPGLLLGCGVLLGGQGAIAIPLAAPLYLAQMPATDQSTLQEPIDRFLQAIPPGYYGVRQIDALKAKMEQGNLYLVDVREPSEYLLGHIPGAVNIPLRKLAENLDQIPKDEPVMLYCSTGYRTGIGVAALHLLGYDNVEGFPPSYEGWKQAQR